MVSRLVPAFEKVGDDFVEDAHVVRYRLGLEKDVVETPPSVYPLGSVPVDYKIRDDTLVFSILSCNSATSYPCFHFRFKSDFFKTSRLDFTQVNSSYNEDN